jgi:hypothetical protein
MSISPATLEALESVSKSRTLELRLIQLPSVVFAALVAYLAHF